MKELLIKLHNSLVMSSDGETSKITRLGAQMLTNAVNDIIAEEQIEAQFERDKKAPRGCIRLHYAALIYNAETGEYEETRFGVHDVPRTAYNKAQHEPFFEKSMLPKPTGGVPNKHSYTKNFEILTVTDENGRVMPNIKY